MKNPIYLVSTGRTGTKYFSNFFSTYGIDVTSYHTSKFTRTVNVLGNMYRQKMLSRRMMKMLLKHIKFHSVQSHNSRYIECNPYYYNIIDIIDDFFPEAKFIFVVRSPKSFISSYIKMERQRWKSTIANRLIPFWQPTSYLDQIRGIGNNYYQRVEFFSKVWARKNTTIMKALSGRNNSISLRFEQVFNPATGVDVMKGLIKWLDIGLKKPITQEMIVTKKNATIEDNVNSWDGHCTTIMNRYCSSVLRDLGYE